ncbi:MAG: hypothetical protein RMJ33_12540 [Saprospiraceae bacterium]|nr:hypothetical protein [Saprospiraceae bacterium]MDW8230656.1 hypothetical protein [Saprospiraceae bacterium]
MRIGIVLVVFMAVWRSYLIAQSTAFVLGGGPSIGWQRWDNSFDRQPLFKYHAMLAIESVDNKHDRNSVFAQFGYHVRGSANRFTFFQGIGSPLLVFTEEFQFRNLALTLGAKQKFDWGAGKKYFYAVGLRGEYTLSTNLNELVGGQNPVLQIYYPFEGAVNRWLAGAFVGGGLELPFSDLVGGQLMFSVSPDFLLQYNQPPIENVIDPLNPGQRIRIPERRIRNLSMELTLSIRLLRKVIYE